MPSRWYCEKMIARPYCLRRLAVDDNVRRADSVSGLQDAWRVRVRIVEGNFAWIERDYECVIGRDDAFFQPVGILVFVFVRNAVQVTQDDFLLGNIVHLSQSWRGDVVSGIRRAGCRGCSLEPDALSLVKDAHVGPGLPGMSPRTHRINEAVTVHFPIARIEIAAQPRPEFGIGMTYLFRLSAAGRATCGFGECGGDFRARGF